MSYLSTAAIVRLSQNQPKSPGHAPMGILEFGTPDGGMFFEMIRPSVFHHGLSGRRRIHPKLKKIGKNYWGRHSLIYHVLVLVNINIPEM